jgi:tetratricopeptide (TPR) repeat protein
MTNWQTGRNRVVGQYSKLPPVIGPRLRRLIGLVFTVVAVLSLNSVYLGSITLLEWRSGEIYQDYFYQLMFLLHLVLGLFLILPVIIFGIGHARNAWRRPNRRAVRAGIGVFSTAIIVLGSGVILTRFGFLEIRDPEFRSITYWVHILSPLALVWLFVLHRLVGKPIQWRLAKGWGVFALLLIGVGSVAHTQLRGQETMSSERPFLPSLARTETGKPIPATALMRQDYCQECHAGVTERWKHSVHHLSSFNNPAYSFSVQETRKVAYETDGSVRTSRFCAGCHDPVPLFSGAFDNPAFDTVNDPTAKAGITCTACHAITRINSPRGNADYTIQEPQHYPFAFSDNAFLQWVSRQLIKAKPAYHKETFLKPLHKSAEFCGVCHKTHLPTEVNNYKWLPGQNHYDSWLLSGVSGHGVASFYYPTKAVKKCAECHMPLRAAKDEFGGRHFEGFEQLAVHDHLFAAANTAIPYLAGLPEEIKVAHREFLEGVVRVDIFGVKEGGTIDAQLTAPVRPAIPALTPGKRYLFETVVRTLKPGHLFTQGTSDSNEVWLELNVYAGDRLIGRSGAMNDEGDVDPWAHFINAYVLDRHGNRIDRRNAQDIFVKLYDHQIPPGAADVIHYEIEIPEDISEPVSVEAKVKYRKFDTTYLKYILAESFTTNQLPITVLASDRVVFPVAGGSAAAVALDETAAIWERWNDYGIGLLLKSGKGSSKGELRQAEHAFRQVEQLARPEGPLNLARVYLQEGRLDEAAGALHRAAEAGAYPWSVAWFSGLVNKQNGFLDEALQNFYDLASTSFTEARQRGFDFSKDYRLLNEIGGALFEKAKRQRGELRRTAREALLAEASEWFHRTLDIDPENLSAHYNLALIYAQLGDTAQAEEHRRLHAAYKPDDNAQEHAVAVHRRSHPPANHAAEAVVVYDLQRETKDGLTSSTRVAFGPSRERPSDP